MSREDLKLLETQNEQRRLSREQLLAPRQYQEEMEIIGLGGTVIAKSLTNKDRQEIRAMSTGIWKEDGTFEVRAASDGGVQDDERFKLLAICRSIIDPLLTFEDASLLNEQDAGVIDEIELKLSTMNLMGKASEAKKESKETPSSDTDSSSPNGSE